MRKKNSLNTDSLKELTRNEGDPYFFKLFKILSIQFVIDLRYKCSFHQIELVPLKTFKPSMVLIKYSTAR